MGKKAKKLEKPSVAKKARKIVRKRKPKNKIEEANKFYQKHGVPQFHDQFQEEEVLVKAKPTRKNAKSDRLIRAKANR